MEPVPTTHELAGSGVEQRLTATLVGVGPLAVVPMRLRDPQLPFAARPPDEPLHPRVIRGLTLRGLPDDADEAFAVLTALWRGWGYRMAESSGPEGRLVVARDDQGFTLALTRGTEAPVLIVASPRITARAGGSHHGLTVGLASGVVVGFLGPCVSITSELHRLTEMAGVDSPFFGWLPVLLVSALVLIAIPRSRPFGIGLLVGGAAVGIVIGGTCTSMV